MKYKLFAIFSFSFVLIYLTINNINLLSNEFSNHKKQQLSNNKLNTDAYLNINPNTNNSTKRILLSRSDDDDNGDDNNNNNKKSKDSRSSFTRFQSPFNPQGSTPLQKSTSKFPLYPTPDKRIIDFMVIGVQKGGSTTIFRRLRSHPNVTMAYPKETRFFRTCWQDFACGARITNDKYEEAFVPKSDDFTTLNRDNIIEEYATRHLSGRLYSNKYEIRGEATPGYIKEQIVAKRVKFIFPHLKFILCLRNPTERAFSEFSMNVRNLFPDSLSSANEETNSKNSFGGSRLFRNIFSEDISRIRKCQTSENKYWYRDCAIENDHYTAQGLYYYQLRDWFEVFPRERFLIVETEDLNEPNFNKRLFEFVGVEPSDFEVPEEEENAGNADHFRMEINKDDKQLLNKFYAPFNKKLEELLGRKFNDWFN